MNHEPFDTLAAVYAVDALDGEDRVRFEAHLAAGCADCAAMLRDSSEALAALAREVTRVIPPPHVKAELQRRIADTLAPPRRQSEAPLRWRWLLGSAAAAMLVAGLAAGLV